MEQCSSEMVFLVLIVTTCVLAIPSPSSSHQDLANQESNQATGNIFNKSRTEKKIKNENGANRFQAKEKDLQGSASEYGVPNFVPPSGFHDVPYGKDCHSCNDQPWIPIHGRSLTLPQNKEFHFDGLNHDIFDKTSHFHSFYPSLDQYSAPQTEYDYPRPGEIVEFMLPPPLSLRKPFTSFGDHERPLSGPSSSGFTGNIYSTAIKKNIKPQNFRYSSLSQDMLPPPYASGFSSYPQSFANQYSFSSVKNNFGSPGGSLRPAAPHTYPQFTFKAEGLPGVGKLPLSHNNFHLKGPIPSDSYGQPLLPNSDPPFNPLPPSLPTLSDTIQLPSVDPSDSYGSPIPQFDNEPSAQQRFPFRRPLENYKHQATGEDLKYVEGFGRGEINLRPPHIESAKATLFQTGKTDVQVVPSVKIADYTASVEHPINLIQSPILDLVAKNQKSPEILNNVGFDYNSVRDTQGKNNILDLDVASNTDNIKLSENPIVAKNDDSFSSASSVVNTTVPSSITTVKRHNDKYLSTGQATGSSDLNQNINWFKNMILDNNKDTVDKKSIVAIKQMIIDPTKIKANLKIAQPNVDVSTWRSLKEKNNGILDHMTPPIPQSVSWKNTQSERAKPLQIIVPYVKTNASLSHNKNNYKFEYTRLSSIVTPPSTQAEQSLWPKYSEDQSVQSNTIVEETTQVYNIKDFISENAYKSADLPLPYDVISLQKNIDKWTHQSYSNIQGFGALRGMDSDGKKKPDIYLKDENKDQKFFSTEKIEAETDQILGSGSDNIEQAVANNEINKEDFDEYNNGIKENYIDDDLFDDNFLKNDDIETTTSKIVESSSYPTIRFGMKQEKQLWHFDKEIKSNATHEKVYVVTPQSYAFVTSTPTTAYSMAPKIQGGKVNKHPVITKISVRVERENITRLGDHAVGHPVKVIYSEWPHIINNLETTTTTLKPTSRHPLFGLMDLPSYTPPPNSTVETIGGHSKVTMGVTTSTNTVRAFTKKVS